MSDACELLIRLLDEQGVEYELRPVGSLAWRHGALRPFAMVETCLLSIDSEYALATFCVDATLDLELLTEELATRVPVRIASDAEVRRECPGWRPEALPAIGNLFGLLVYVSEDLAQEERIAFPAGDGKRAVHISYLEFERLVKPCEVPLCTRDLASRDLIAITPDEGSAALP